DEAPADHERTETGGYHRSGTSEPEPGPALDTRHLAIRDDVPEVRSELHPERDRQPDRVEMPELVQHALEPSGPGDAHGRAERQCCADPDEEGVLSRMPVQMRKRSKEALEGHRTRIGRPSGPLKPSALRIGVP